VGKKVENSFRHDFSLKSLFPGQGAPLLPELAARAGRRNAYRPGVGRGRFRGPGPPGPGVPSLRRGHVEAVPAGIEALMGRRTVLIFARDVSRWPKKARDS